MALMFSRFAHNHAKNGYYPTDDDSVRLIAARLRPCEEGVMRLIDPCCGEGSALAQCQAKLGLEHSESFGVEYNSERAWEAKSRLNRCIHADYNDTVQSPRGFGLLWLNPPYGDLVSDQQATTRSGTGRARLEKQFFQATSSLLQFGGVLVLIVPRYVLDRQLSGWLANQYRDLSVYQAAVDDFQQVVIFGVRRRTSEAGKTKPVRDRLMGIADGTVEPPPLPEPHETDLPVYDVPAAPKEMVKFYGVRLDAEQLSDELNSQPTFWQRWPNLFVHAGLAERRPVRRLSDWHLALSLAAGQIAGEVHAADGRVYVIRGSTHKEQDTRVTQEYLDNGSTREIRTLTDRFVPVIRALDMTTGSATFGELLTIR